MAEIKIYGKLKAYTEEGKVADASDISGLSPIATEGLTYAAIIAALGYTPYDSSNPAGYLTQHQDISGKANKNEVIPYYRVTSFDCNDTSLSGSSIYRVNATPAHAANNNYSVILNFLDLGTPIQIQIPDANERYVYKRTKSSGIWQNWFKMSAGDSDTVAGLSVHSGRNNEANKVVRTDGNGYIQAGYINSSDGDENNYSEPARIWGTNGSDSYLRTYNASTVIVGKVFGTYSGNGGQQGPGYYGRNRVGFLMSNQPVNGYTSYTNWLYMDNYNGDDVGGATAIGVARTQPRAFIMQSDANRNSWNNITELISVYNISSYAIANAGSSPNLNDGTTVTQPGGENAISIKTPGSAHDTGIFYMSQDNAYICNSSDNAYSFAVFDTDLTTNFSSVNDASFVVLSSGTGAKIRGNRVLHSGNTFWPLDNSTLYVNATSGSKYMLLNFTSAQLQIRFYSSSGTLMRTKTLPAGSYIVRFLPWELTIKNITTDVAYNEGVTLSNYYRIGFYCPNDNHASVMNITDRDIDPNPSYDR